MTTVPFEHDDFNDLELFETLEDMGADYDPDGYPEQDFDDLLEMFCSDLDDDSFEDDFNEWMNEQFPTD